MGNARIKKKANKEKYLKKLPTSTSIGKGKKKTYSQLKHEYDAMIKKEQEILIKKANRRRKAKALEAEKFHYLTELGVLPEKITTTLLRSSWDKIRKITYKRNPELFGIDLRRPPSDPKTYRSDHYIAILFADRSGNIDFNVHPLFYESMTIRELKEYLEERFSRYGGDTSFGRASHLFTAVFPSYGEAETLCKSYRSRGYQYMIANEFSVRGFLKWQLFCADITTEKYGEEAIRGLNAYVKEYMPDMYHRIETFSEELEQNLPEIPDRNKKRRRKHA